MQSTLSNNKCPDISSSDVVVCDSSKSRMYLLLWLDDLLMWISTRLLVILMHLNQLFNYEPTSTQTPFRKMFCFRKGEYYCNWVADESEIRFILSGTDDTVNTKQSSMGSLLQQFIDVPVQCNAMAGNRDYELHADYSSFTPLLRNDVQKFL